jgi:hypothetical protein
MQHRVFGQTASNISSQYYPGEGAYTDEIAPPDTIAFSEISSIASHITQYFNILCSVAS